ncbi:helix-turn-helix domain-containing protein [Leifsonia poae]|uniref:helix-turn-helix domain-containing protein n=1 Tax=Leifsonia poae TaxID=110933 RepID=UPI001CBDE35E|nr:helix-turn-helix domain-containing protein [Leifsonia poae]
MEDTIEPPPAGDAAQSPAAVAAALGLPTIRLDVLRALAAHGTATVSQLGEHVGCTRNGLACHLDALERIGVIRYEIRRVSGSCRPARVYRLESARVEEVAWLVFDALVDDLPTTQPMRGAA